MAAKTIKIASYNMRKCIGLDRVRDPGRTLDVINGLDADIVALQEADKRLGRRPAALPQELLTAHSDYDAVPADPDGVSLGHHGNAILVRRGVTVDEVRPIDLPGTEPRGALTSDIIVEGHRLRMIGTHLGLWRGDRRRQLAALRATLDDAQNTPTVLAGDLNEWSPTKGLEDMDDRLRFHAPGRSFHAARPIAALDRIGHCAKTTVRDAGVFETRQSKRASDHLPVWVELEWKSPAS